MSRRRFLGRINGGFAWAFLFQAASLGLRPKVQGGRSGDAGDLDRGSWSRNASEVNDGAENDDGGAGSGSDSNPSDSLLTYLVADRQKSLKTRRTVGDVVQLGLRHRHDSPGHAVQGLGIGTANSFGIWKLSERRFLQLFANPFDVHSIAYYALTSIGVMP